MTGRLAHFRLGAVAALAFALGASTWAAEPFRKLNSNEIIARFTGTELTDEVHWAFVFGKAGALSTFSMGRTGTGTWTVRDDELCLDLPVDGLRCSEVWMAGTRVELRREAAPPEEGMLQKPQKRK